MVKTQTSDNRHSCNYPADKH